MRALTTVLVVLGCLAPTGAGHPVAENSAPIIAGAAAPADHAVVGLAHASGEPPFCTGTLVSPHIVVTAAHCINPPLLVFFEDAGARVEVAVAASQSHPDFSLEPLAHDIGLVELATPAPSFARAITLSRTPPTAGESARFVGYGYTEVGARGDYGTRLARTADITSVAATTFRYGVATCEGDSGGPALITRAGREVLAGVTSSGDGVCGLYGIDTRVDPYAAWIDEKVAATEPALEAGGCALASGRHTEGATSALALVVVIVVGFARRRPRR